LRIVAPSVIAGAAAIALLILFPIYHRLGVRRDVLGWGPVTAWGPETAARKADTGPIISFGRAERVDQGVTFLLQHAQTRRLDASELGHLRVLAACRPSGCSLEARVLVSADANVEGSWPWATFGPEPTEQWLALDGFGPAVRERGPVAVTLTRTESVRKRDGEPLARTLELYALEFR